MSEEATNGSEPKKRKRNYSPETLEKFRQNAQKLHAEGRLGGAEYGKLGGRGNKRDRAAKAVAEAAQENAEKIIRVFKDGIKDDQPMRTRLKAAEAWLAIENQEGKLALQEEHSDANQMSREQLIAAIREGLTNGPMAAALAGALEQETGIVDAEVVEENGDDRAA